MAEPASTSSWPAHSETEIKDVNLDLIVGSIAGQMSHPDRLDDASRIATALVANFDVAMNRISCTS